MKKSNKRTYDVIGFKPIKYVRTKDNREVSGVEVYLQPTEFDDGVQGIQCEAVYLSDAYSTYSPDIGDTVFKSYNQFGRVDDLMIVHD